MPYYCTVPRCTSMAGKIKDVSFHQFPRDEILADEWNRILKRGKPYTKYSKVCSLHFAPSDYVLTNVGKNKGQWRSLRKDAIPSRNLPSESPQPATVNSSSAPAFVSSDVVDQQMKQQQQQLAQAVYMQTMLAFHLASLSAPSGPDGDLDLALALPLHPSSTHHSDSEDKCDSEQSKENVPQERGDPLSLLEDRSKQHPTQQHPTQQHPTQQHPTHGNPFFNNSALNQNLTTNNLVNSVSSAPYVQHNPIKCLKPTKSAYKCELCSKCFKDPDVFLLHKRWHRADSGYHELPELPDPNRKLFNDECTQTASETNTDVEGGHVVASYNQENSINHANSLIWSKLYNSDMSLNSDGSTERSETQQNSLHTAKFHSTNNMDTNDQHGDSNNIDLGNAIGSNIFSNFNPISSMAIFTDPLILAQIVSNSLQNNENSQGENMQNGGDKILEEMKNNMKNFIKSISASELNEKSHHNRDTADTADTTDTTDSDNENETDHQVGDTDSVQRAQLSDSRTGQPTAQTVTDNTLKIEATG